MGSGKGVGFSHSGCHGESVGLAGCSVHQLGSGLHQDTNPSNILLRRLNSIVKAVGSHGQAKFLNLHIVDGQFGLGESLL